MLLNFIATHAKIIVFFFSCFPWCSAWHSGQLMFIPQAAGFLMSAIWQTPSKLSCDIYSAVAPVQPLYTMREWCMERCIEGSRSIHVVSRAAVLASLLWLWSGVKTVMQMTQIGPWCLLTYFPPLIPMITCVLHPELTCQLYIFNNTATIAESWSFVELV